MNPRTCLLGLLLAAGLMLPAWSQPPEKPARPAAGSADALARRIDLPGFDDPKTTLAEALDLLSRVADVRIDVAVRAGGENDPQDDPAKIELGGELPLRRGIPLARALDRILARASQVKDRPLTYLVRPDGLEVVTVETAVKEVWDNEPGPYLPLVHRRFRRQPLDEALAQLAADTGINVIVDGRAAERARTPVSARFLNTPVDTAVRILADMADLKPVLRDNLLYVTTPDNAARIEAREPQPLPGTGGDEPKRRAGKGRGPFLQAGPAAALGQ